MISLSYWEHGGVQTIYSLGKQRSSLVLWAHTSLKPAALVELFWAPSLRGISPQLWVHWSFSEPVSPLENRVLFLRWPLVSGKNCASLQALTSPVILLFWTLPTESLNYAFCLSTEIAPNSLQGKKYHYILLIFSTAWYCFPGQNVHRFTFITLLELTSPNSESLWKSSDISEGSNLACLQVSKSPLETNLHTCSQWGPV